MSKHDFIFSDKLAPRLLRHVAFWVIWVMVHNLLFHYPIHVFKGWDLDAPRNPNLQKLGPGLFFFKTYVVNSLIAVIVPQILFTYLFIFRIAPKLFWDKSSIVTKLLTTLFSAIALFLTASIFKYAPSMYNLLTGTSPQLDDYGLMLKSSFIDQVSTTPLVLGAALTITFFKKSYLHQKKTEQLLKENLYAELAILKAQIHPHFLFNTINNIYFHTLTLSTQAADLLRRLSDLMKYFLTECNQPVVLLKKELDSLNDYISLEKIRYGDDLHLELSLPRDPPDLFIAPMLLIPFIENSFKHGASLSVDRSFIRLQVEIRDCWLIYNLENDIHDNPGIQRTKGNIGLSNVRKRLALLYPDAHVLNTSATLAEYKVELMIDLKKLKLPK